MSMVRCMAMWIDARSQAGPEGLPEDFARVFPEATFLEFEAAVRVAASSIADRLYGLESERADVLTLLGQHDGTELDSAA